MWIEEAGIMHERTLRPAMPTYENGDDLVEKWHSKDLVLPVVPCFKDLRRKSLHGMLLQTP